MYVEVKKNEEEKTFFNFCICIFDFDIVTVLVDSFDNKVVDY